MRILHVFLSSLIALLFLAPSQAQNSSPVYNVVTVEIVSNGRLVGKPQFTMELGSTAVAEYAAPNGYSMKVVLDDAESLRIDERNVDVELYLPERDRWVLSGHPVVRTHLKQSSAVSFATRSGKSVEITVSVDEGLKPVTGIVHGKSKDTAAETAFWKNSLDKPVSYSTQKAVMQ